MEKNQEERKIPVIVVKKTSYLFVTFLIRKNRYYRICIYWTGSRISPRRNKFICRRNTYPRSTSQEEEKEKTPFPTSLPLDQRVYSRVRGKNKDPVSSSSCWRWWIYSPENWHKQWYFSISGRTPGDRTDHGRMALCSVLHHLTPCISAADSCRRRPTLWSGWSPQRAGLRIWSTECRSQTGDIRTKVAQDAGTAGEYFWAINTPDNSWTLRIRKMGRELLWVNQVQKKFNSSWIIMNRHTDAWSLYILFLELASWISVVLLIIYLSGKNHVLTAAFLCFAWTAFWVLFLLHYFPKVFSILDRQSLLNLMEATKDSPDVKQELLNRLFPEKNDRAGWNGYLPSSEKKWRRKNPSEWTEYHQEFYWWTAVNE